MTTDFRALCDELVKELDDLRESSEGVAGLHRNGDLAPWSELGESGEFPWLSSFDRARAALTKRQHIFPTPSQAAECGGPCYEGNYCPEACDCGLYKPPAPPTEAEGPSDEEVEVWADQQGFIRGHGDHPCGFWIDDGDAGAFARAVLARWGHPAATPVPVSERLPGPEDCDGEGKVWAIAYLNAWMRVHHSMISRWKAWLPANALPLPAPEGGEVNK